MPSDCIFCKIANKVLAAKIVFEDADVIAFNDIHPIAPVHVLIIPKRHIAAISDTKDSDLVLMGKLIISAKKIAENSGISRKGYKLLLRVGKDGGQEVNHIHLHLIGGIKLSENIRPLK